MHTSKLTKRLTQIVIFHYHLVSWYKFQIHVIGTSQDLSVGLFTGYKVRASTQEITQIIFTILISHVATIYIGFWQRTLKKATNSYMIEFTLNFYIFRIQISTMLKWKIF